MNPTKLIIALTLMIATSAFGQMRLVNFDDLPGGGTIAGGTAIDNQYSVWGVTFSYSGPESTYLRAYDTSSSGEDPDLNTPGSNTGNLATDWSSGSYIFGDAGGAGNVLIIQNDSDPDPNDDPNGGIINIVFDNAVTFTDMGILDMALKLYDKEKKLWK